MASWKKLLIGIGTVIAVTVLAWFATEPLRVKAEEHYLARGDDSYIAGNTKDALIQYKKAALLVWTDSEPHYRAGAVYFENGDFNQAEKELQKALAHQPENFDARAGLAQIYNTQGKFDQAIEVLQKTSQVTGLESIKYKVAALEAQNLLAQEKNDQAAEILSQYDKSGDPAVKYYQILTLLIQQKYQDAAEKLNQLKIQLPTLEEESESKSPKIIYIDNTKIKKDVPVFEEAVTKIQKTASPLTQQLITAQLLFQIKLTRVAANLAEKVAKEDEKYRDAWVVLGQSYLDLKEYTKAKDALDKALKIDPIHAPAWKLLGQVFEAQGEIQKAKEYYSKAEKLR